MSCSHEKGFPFVYFTFKEKHKSTCPNDDKK